MGMGQVGCRWDRVAMVWSPSWSTDSLVRWCLAKRCFPQLWIRSWGAVNKRIPVLTVFSPVSQALGNPALERLNYVPAL